MHSTSGQPGSSNPSPANKDPGGGTAQPVLAEQASQDAATDQVIPIKAGDMDLDVATHAKVRRSGEVFMFANSSLTTTVDLPSDLQSLSIFAHADKAGGEWPHLLVMVNGEVVGEVIVNSSVDKKFYVPVSMAPGSANIGVAFVNDFNDPTTFEDRNVYVSKIKVHVQR